MNFKFESNSLYALSVLEQKKIVCAYDEDASFRLFVKPEDYDDAINIVSALELDEKPVSDECDGYIQGYIEWIDKQYVNGYFTGGVIPNWMYSKLYARYAGSIYLLYAIFLLYTSIINTDNLGLMWISLTYFIVGFLLTIKGFKKSIPGGF